MDDIGDYDDDVMIRFDSIQFDLIWFDLIWFDMLSNNYIKNKQLLEFGVYSLEIYI